MKFRPAKIIFRFPIGLAAALLASYHLHADVRNWDGDTSVTWATAANWDTLPAVSLTTDIANFNLPTYGGNPVFAPSTGTTSIAGITVGSSNGAMTITPGALSIGASGINVANGAGTTGITPGAVTLGATQSWTNDSANLFTVGSTIATGGFIVTSNGTGNTTLGGIISGIGGIAKSGAGTLTLNGANTFTTGGISLSGGILNLGNNAALGGGGSVLTITGGTIDVTAARATTNAQAWNGNFTFAGSNTWSTGSGAITLGSNRQVTVSASTMTVGGIIGDGGSGFQLTKAGAGTLVLSNANTLTGGISLTDGTLSLGNNAALGGAAGALTITGGTIDVTAVRTTTNNNAQNWNGDFTFAGTNTWNTGTGAITLNSTVQVTVSASTMTVGGAIGGGAFGLTKAGAGTLVLSGSNTYTGATTISAGTLSVAVTENLGGPASNLVFDGGTLQITGTTLTSVTGIGHTVVTNSGKTVGLDINNSGNTFTFDQVLNQGAGGLTKLGAGTLVLNQSNTYTGATSINQGSISVATVGNSGANSNLGTNGTINLGATTVPGTLVYTGTGETTNKVINLAGSTGGATITQSGSGNLLFTSNITNTGSGAKTLTLSGSTAGTAEISGAIGDVGGTVSVTKSGSGTWTLSGTNTYSGLTFLNGASGSLIASGTNSSAGATTVQSGALLFNNTSNGGIASGLLTISSGASIQAAIAGITLSNPVTLTTSSGGTSFFGTQSLVFNGDVNFTGTSNKGINNTMTNGSTVTLNGDLVLNNTAANIYNNNAPNGGTAPGTVIVNGIVRTGGAAVNAGSVSNSQGALILTNNANSYAGATTVSGGTMAGTAAHAFGDTTGINISGSSAILSLRGDATTNFTQLTGGALYEVKTSASGATINVDQATAAGTALKTMGIGALTLNTATSNTTNFTGANSTGLSVGAVSTGAGVSGTETINNSISSTGLLTLASIASNRTTGSPQTLAFTGNGNTTVTGAISQPGGAVINLTKSGTGTLTLSGANTYTGTTTVNASSILVVSGSLVAGSGLVTVNNTATLGGNGNIGGPVTIASGGTHALAVGTTPGTQITRTISGTLNLISGSTLNLIPAPTTSGGTYILVNATSITGTLGTPDLSAFPPGSTVTIVGGNSLQLNVPGGSDYDTWVASIPGTFAPTGPTDDADNDGLTNQEEYAFGLVPNSGSSVNPMTALLDPTTGQFTYTRRKPSLTGLVYAYEYSTNLSGWTAFTPAATSSNSGDPVEAVTVTVTAGLLTNPKLFIRVTAQ